MVVDISRPFLLKYSSKIENIRIDNLVHKNTIIVASKAYKTQFGKVFSSLAQIFRWQKDYFFQTIPTLKTEKYMKKPF